MNDLFKPADMPSSQIVTVNRSRVTEEGVRVPVKFGWNLYKVVRSPDLAEWEDWIPSFGSGQVSCLCPSKFSSDRRLSADPRALCYWLGLDFDSPKAPTLEALVPQLSAFAGFYYTTKSHRKTGHDRYRVMMAYSRPVTHSENLRIHGVLALKIHHDKACGDVTRVFWPSIQGCTRGSLGGTSAVDVEHLLTLAAALGVEGKVRSSGGRSCGPQNWEAGVVDNKLRNRLLQIWNVKYQARCRGGEVNTRDAVWAMMHRALETTQSLPDILCTLESIPFFTEWVNRKNEDYQTKLLEVYQDHMDRETEVLKEYQPVHEIIPVDVSGLPSIPEKYKAVLDAYRALKGYPVTPLHDLTHRAIASIGPGKHVLDIGCGLEKSVGASVLASVSPTPVWLVCEHHRACGDVLRRLAEMGTDMSEVAYIPGFGRQSCIMYDDFHMGDISPREIYNHQDTPCSFCPHKERCEFAKRLFHFKACTRNRVVVMTHSMFVLKFEPWGDAAKQWGYTPETMVIIDEQLRRWETGAFDMEEIRMALSEAGIEPEPIQRAITEALEGSGVLDDSGRTMSGVGVMADGVGVESRSDAIKTLNGKNLDEDTLNRCIEIITLLGAGKLHYVMQNDGVRILSDQRAWSMPDNCIMLDGSARFTQVRWDDFKFWSVKAPDYTGLTVHVVRGNPTKAGMIRKAADFDMYVEKIRSEVHPARVVHAIDKPLEGAKNTGLPGYLKQGDMEAHRGTGTRGSNDFIECDMMVIRMALFTDINDYALRAALGSGGSIKAEDIWKKTEKAIRPNMHKTGFVHPSLQVAAHRQMVDELYQAILRIGVRRYDGGKYTAVCTLPDDLSVALLTELLPGAEITQYNFPEKLGNRNAESRGAERKKRCLREAVESGYYNGGSEALRAKPEGTKARGTRTDIRGLIKRATQHAARQALASRY